jgi:hypothetical protein
MRSILGGFAQCVKKFLGRQVQRNHRGLDLAQGYCPAAARFGTKLEKICLINTGFFKTAFFANPVLAEKWDS